MSADHADGKAGKMNISTVRSWSVVTRKRSTTTVDTAGKFDAPASELQQPSTAWGSPLKNGGGNFQPNSPNSGKNALAPAGFADEDNGVFMSTRDRASGSTVSPRMAHMAAESWATMWEGGTPTPNFSTLPLESPRSPTASGQAEPQKLGRRGGAVPHALLACASPTPCRAVHIVRSPVVELVRAVLPVAMEDAHTGAFSSEQDASASETTTSGHASPQFNNSAHQPTRKPSGQAFIDISPNSDSDDDDAARPPRSAGVSSRRSDPGPPSPDWFGICSAA